MVANYTKSTSDELIETLKKVVSFLKEANQRSMSLIQRKILLNSKLDELAGNINDFISDLTLNSEQKVDTLLEALNLSQEVLNNIPDAPVLSNTWLSYTSFVNFVRATLANIHLDSDSIRSYSSANILSHLLLDDIKKMESLPELPPYDNPTKFFETYIPLSNALQSTASIFSRLIQNIRLVSIQDLSYWGDMTIYNFHLFRELVKLFDIIKLLETKKVQKMDRLLNNVFTFANTVSILFYTFIDLHLKFRGIWPEDFNTYGELERLDLRSIKKLNENIIEFNLNMYELLQEGYSKKLISINDKPEDGEFYRDYELVLKDSNYLTQQIEVYLKMVDPLDPSNLDRIDKLIILGDEVFSLIFKISGGREKIADSFYVGSFLDTFINILPFYALKALYLNNTNILENLLLEYRDILSGFREHTNLFFTTTLAELFVYSRLDDEIDFNEYYQSLLDKLKDFELNPRTYVTVIHLTVLISYFIPSVSANDREELLAKAESRGLLSNDLEVYKEDFLEMKNSFLESRSINQAHPINNRLKIIELDPFSFLIPDFTKLLERRQLPNWKYFPFNRACDSIIP